MAIISEHINLYRTCINILHLQGWKIEINPGPYEAEDIMLDNYTAYKDGTQINADNPISLMGLAKIHEFHHPYEDKSYWWSIPTERPDFYDQLQDKALDDCFLDYYERKPEECRSLIQQSIHESRVDESVSVEDRLGISKDLLHTFLEKFDLKL